MACFWLMPPTVFLPITHDTIMFDIRGNLKNLTPTLVEAVAHRCRYAKFHESLFAFKSSVSLTLEVQVSLGPSCYF